MVSSGYGSVQQLQAAEGSCTVVQVEMCAASLRGSSTLSVPHSLQEESEQQQNGGSSGNGGGPDPKKGGKSRKEGAAQVANSVMDKAGVSLGPIGLTVGSELQNLSLDDEDGVGAAPRPQSYASLSTAEWRALYEKDGYVDLWVEEEFNSGSRLIVSGAVGRAAGVEEAGVACHAGPTCALQTTGNGRQFLGLLPCQLLLAGSSLLCPLCPRLHIAQGGSAVYRGGVAGYLSGEGPGLETAQRHKVRITNNYTNEEFEVEVPEDRCAARARQGRGMLVAMCLSDRASGMLWRVCRAVQPALYESAQVCAAALCAACCSCPQLLEVLPSGCWPHNRLPRPPPACAGTFCGQRRRRATTCPTLAAWAAAPPAQ